MLTINQFTNILKTLSDSHEQIRSFGEGNPWEIGVSEAVAYPLLWMTPLPSNTAQKILTLKFRLIFADLVYADKSNEQEVLSDTLQMALDILAILNDPVYADDFILDPNTQLIPFTEKFDDDVAGWKVDLQIRVNYLSDRCAVPSALGTLNIAPLCAPVIVKNSDGSFSASFDSGATPILADIQFTDSDGTVNGIPGQKNIIAKSLSQLLADESANGIYDSLVSASKLAGIVSILSDSDLSDLSNTQLQYLVANLITTQFLEDNLGIGTRNSLNKIYSLNSGQTTSYASTDDGDLQHGRLSDFFTLKTNNIFGNTDRFTDENGNQSYSSNYVIDHATGLGWHTALHGSASWASALSASLSLNVGSNTFTDFFLPNINEVLSICSWSQVCLNYAPFNLNPGGSSQIWTSTTNYSNTISAIRVSYQSIPGASSGVKAANQPFLLCRIHF